MRPWRLPSQEILNYFSVVSYSNPRDRKNAKAQRKKERGDDYEDHVSHSVPQGGGSDPREVARQGEHHQVTDANGDQHPRSKATREKANRAHQRSTNQ